MGTLTQSRVLAEVARRTARAEVAILAVNWNGGPFIRKCVGEVARLTPVNHLHAVWDNASGDGSLEWLLGRPGGILTIPCRLDLKHDALLQELSRAVRSPYTIVLDSDA